MNRLTEAERDQLLTPCDCGHSINDHGSLDTCWTCSDDNQECAYYFEDLLTARIGAIVAARLASVEALADEWERESRRIRAAPVHFRGLAEEAEARAKQLRAVLGSDAHTEQKGAGEWRCDHTQHDTARCVPTKHYAKDDTQ